jgi:UDP-glucose 4-epimerase
LTVWPADLADVDQVTEGLAEADAVLHLAVGRGPTAAVQLDATRSATAGLLQAMDRAGVSRLVLCSSFSVYDLLALPRWARLDESAPLEAQPQARDGYTQAKLMQEQQVQAWSKRGERSATILRLGMLTGPGHLWNAWLGTRLGDRWWLRIGGAAPLPLVSRADAAAALVAAVERPEAAGQTLNIVGDVQPTQRGYSRLIENWVEPRPRLMPLPRALFELAAALAARWPARLGGGVSAPGLLRPRVLAARSRPLHYANAWAKQLLRWQPTPSLVAMLRDERAPTTGPPAKV